MEINNYPMIDLLKTGRKMKELCDARQITAKDLQERLHLGTVQAVYHWFGGERLPNVDNLFAMSRILKVSMDELVVAKEDEKLNFGLELERLRHSQRLVFYWNRLQGENGWMD